MVARLRPTMPIKKWSLIDQSIVRRIAAIASAHILQTGRGQPHPKNANANSPRFSSETLEAKKGGADWPRLSCLLFYHNNILLACAPKSGALMSENRRFADKTAGQNSAHIVDELSLIHI